MSAKTIPISPAWNTAPIACRECDLNAICRITGRIGDDGRRSPTMGRMRTLRPGTLLFRAGAPARAFFAIREGTMKQTHITAEGDERIVSFHLPGEVLGLEAFGQGTYDCDAIALDIVQCCELPLPALDRQTPRAATLATQIVRLLSSAIPVQPPLARGSARERVVNFLLDLSRRQRARGRLLSLRGLRHAALAPAARQPAVDHGRRGNTR